MKVVAVNGFTAVEPATLNVVGLVAATAVSFAPGTKTLVRVGVNAWVLPFVPVPKMAAIASGVTLPSLRNGVGLLTERDRAGEHHRAEDRRSLVLQLRVGRARRRAAGFVDVDAGLRADDDAVEQRIVGAAAQQDRVAALRVAALDQRGVRQAGELAGQRVLVAVRVRLDHRVAVAGVALHADHELDEALVAEIGVQAVIVRARDCEVARVDAPAEDLDTVVRAVVHVDALLSFAVAPP